MVFLTRLSSLALDNLHSREFLSVRNVFAVCTNDRYWIADLHRYARLKKCFPQDAFAVRFQRHDGPIVFNAGNWRAILYRTTFGSQVFPDFDQI